MDQPPIPPPQFTAYPRGQLLYGSADRLKTLGEGYFGLNNVFLVNVVLAVASNAITRVSGLTAWVGAGLVIGIVVGFLTFPQNKKIGYACGWNANTPLIASILMGLNSALCCGIIGYIVVQNIAANELKKYGVKGGLFGIKKQSVAAALAELQMAEMTPDPVVPIVPAPTPAPVETPIVTSAPVEPVPDAVEPQPEPTQVESGEPDATDPPAETGEGSDTGDPRPE